MEINATGKERAELLKLRARRLLFFVETFGGRSNPAIEMDAYLILETYRSRPRAIWRYIRYALREWRNSLWFSFQFAPRLWWYRKVRRMEHGAAIDLACTIIEEKIFPAPKGGGHGK